jgi:hypothetical protein
MLEGLQLDEEVCRVMMEDNERRLEDNIRQCKAGGQYKTMSI